MERHDIRMYTSAWKRYYQDSIRGCYMPQLGDWSAASGWIAGDQALHVDGNFINPAPLILIVTGRVRDRDLSVTVNYTTATFSSWDTQFYNGRSYKYPLYVEGVTKSKTFTIPAFTDCETVMRICEEDRLIYKINSVTVTNNRYDERFFIYALASTTARLLYAQNWHVLYETMVREKRGLFAATTVCTTCQGTGLRSEVTCPECGGWGFSGSNATGVMLDNLGKDVGIVRETSEETDESFRKKVWARRWWLIPTKDEIKRYFKHFCHVVDEEIDIIEIPDEQSPTFFVCVNPWEMGAGAIWQAGAQFEDYDGIVEKACPAGVNGYFAWLGYSQEEIGDNPIFDSISSQEWMMNHDGYGSAFEVSQFLEAEFGELLDSTSENMLDDFGIYANDDAIATERPDLWSLVGGSFDCINTNIVADPHDFEWHDVGTFVPEDDPRELWEPHGSLAAETFSNYTPPEDITGGQWTIVGTNVNNTFKAIVYYGAVFSKADTGVATDFKFTFVDSHDMSHKGWFDGDGVRITGICTSYSDMQYAVTRADGTDMMCVRYNSSDNKIEILSDATWIDSGMITYLSSEDTIDMYYQSETTFIVVINGSPIGGSTPTEFTNKAGASWAGGNCASVHFSCPTAGTASMYFSAIMTTWEQSAGDAYNGTFAIQEHTYGGATHRMLEIAWNGLRDNNQEMRVQFPAPIATLSNHVVEFDWMTGGINYQHFLKFYNANGDCIQEIDGYNSTFYLLSEFTNESSGSWQECDFTPVLDTVSYSKYYRIRLTFIDNTHFKMDVYDYATSTWHMGGDLTYADSTTAANLDHMSFCRQTTNSMHYHVADLTLSWLPLTEAVVGTSVGHLEDGEVIGTYPVVSGTVFQNYRAKMDVMFDETAEEYQLEAGITEDSMTDDDDLRIHLSFKNSDKLIYNRWGAGSVPGAEAVETFITWTAGTAISGTGEAGIWSVADASGEDQYIRAADFDMGGGSSRCMFVKDALSGSGGVKGNCFFTDASPHTPSATYQYIVGFDLYISSGSPGQITLGQGNPTKTMMCLLYFATGGQLQGPSAQNSTLTWASGNHYVVQIWIISATQFKVSLDGGSNWSVAMNNYLSASWSGPCTYFEVYSTYTYTGQSYIDNVYASWMDITEVPAEEDSTGIYWNEPHEGARVEKFDQADHTNLDDDAQWAPYTGDDSDEENCGAEYLEGEGHFYSTTGDVNKIYTFPSGSAGTGIVNSYIDVRHDIGSNKNFDIVIGGTDAGGTPAVWLQVHDDGGVVELRCFTGAAYKAVSGAELGIWKKQFKFALDMDNQTFQLYQKVLGIWKLLTIEDSYDTFWNTVSSINLMLLQLSGGISHVYIDNIANDWGTETDSCDATFEVAIVAANEFRIRKGEDEWSPPLPCKNAFTAGIKHLKLKTTSTDGVDVDNLEYSW